MPGTPEGWHQSGIVAAWFTGSPGVAAGDVTAAWVLLHFPPGHKGKAFEVGAADGIESSNTSLLEQLGWDCLCVEANPDYYPALKKRRKRAVLSACDAPGAPVLQTLHVFSDEPQCNSSLRPSYDRSGNWHEVEVKVTTADELVSQAGFERLDFASIDTEGTELDVLRGFDLDRWKPRLMTVEALLDGGPIPQYLETRGYKRLGRVAADEFYERIL